MKTRYLYLFIYILLNTLSPPLKAQQGDTETILYRLFEGIMQTNNPDTRISLNDSLTKIIDGYVRSDSIFSHRFSGLRNLGQIIAQDTKVKLVAWNLILPGGTNKYFLYIIHRKGNKKSLPVVTRLSGENLIQAPDTMKIYDPGNWYGALYYDIRSFRSEGRTHYLVLGLDFGKSRFSRKIIDVLSFDEGGNPNFGYLCFNRNGKQKMRQVIEYTSDGVISLRMNSGKAVIFDRVLPFSAGHEGQADNLGAGLAFDGYIFKGGQWHFRSNIDIKNSRK